MNKRFKINISQELSLISLLEWQDDLLFYFPIFSSPYIIAIQSKVIELGGDWKTDVDHS